MQNVPELNVVPILPEIVVSAVALLILLFDAARPSRKQAHLVALSLAGLLGAAAFLFRAWSVPPAEGLTALG
ncbi:MAG: hypothetical protein M3135_07695, partial [Actinomycetota bacterium]|nr:hypothetical protein [Actinomycetota bacterium]